LPGSRSSADAGPPSPAIEDVSRFRRDLERAIGTSPDRVALAVSGGPDSMALLTLAAVAMPGRILVATVDHGFRPGSADEAATVARHCKTIGAPHATLTPDAPIAGSSIQARARDMRYGLLARWAIAEGAACLATAHHADDQAETFLMRAARGSGLSGLAGIRRRVEIAGVIVVRPLLGWRRAELRAVARRAGAPFVDDPANADPRHDRTRFRALLEQNSWLDPTALAESAAHLAEIDADLRATVAHLWRARVRANGGRVDLDVADLAAELRRRLSRQAITAVREAGTITAPSWLEATNIESFLDALSAGKSAVHAGVMASVRGTVWRFRPAPARRRN